LLLTLPPPSLDATPKRTEAGILFMLVLKNRMNVEHPLTSEDEKEAVEHKLDGRVVHDRHVDQEHGPVHQEVHAQDDDGNNGAENEDPEDEGHRPDNQAIALASAAEWKDD
jgi:hypothetical protein